MSRYSIRNLLDKRDWEGDHYVYTEMSSEDMPTPELEKLHILVQEAVARFDAAVDKLEREVEKEESQ